MWRTGKRIREERLLARLAVLSVSLSCHFGTFLEAWESARLALRFILTLSSPVCSQLSHLHFCDWHISWAPTPGMPSWHGSGSGRVCSASWWLRFCLGQRHSPHCRGKSTQQNYFPFIFIAGWVTVCYCTTPWQSMVIVTGHRNKRRIFHVQPNKDSGNGSESYLINNFLQVCESSWQEIKTKESFCFARFMLAFSDRNDTGEPICLFSLQMDGECWWSIQASICRQLYGDSAVCGFVDSWAGCVVVRHVSVETAGQEWYVTMETTEPS